MSLSSNCAAPRPTFARRWSIRSRSRVTCVALDDDGVPSGGSTISGMTTERANRGTNAIRLADIRRRPSPPSLAAPSWRILEEIDRFGREIGPIRGLTVAELLGRHEEDD